MERLNEAVGGIAGDDVHFFVDERTVDEAEIHDAGRSGKMKPVELAPATEAVGTLEEFVAEASAHLGGVGDDVADVAEVKALGVVGADDQSEGGFESEGLGDLKVELLGIALFHAIVDIVRVAAGRFIE